MTQAFLPNRQQNKRSESEAAILRAAEAVFAEAGFGGATMREIAERAGLPKTNVHYYFATKEELYRRVVSDIFEIWLQAASSFDEASTPAEGIGAYIDAKMDLSRSHPDASRVWATEVMHGAPIIQDYLETTLVEWTEGRMASIQAWIDAGQMDPINPRYLMYMIWATTQHYADFAHQIETLNRNTPMSDAQWDEAKATVRRILLRGLGIAI